MIFRVTMKDPDTLYDAIKESICEDIDRLNLKSESEYEAIKEIRIDEINSFCREWFKYGEYLTVEIDTDKKTCVVVPAMEK